MKKLMLSLALILTLIPWRPAAAFNPVKDVLQNTTFPIGQVASAGTAVNLKNGETSTSMLAEVADYRMFALSWGGTRVNQNDANFTDTLKIGFKLNWLISQFTQPLPPTAAFLKNINVGPSIASPVLSGPRQVNYFFDINYTFGGNTGALTPVATPAP
jgi:hypothetical protein